MKTLRFQDAFWDNSPPGEPLDYRRAPSKLYVEAQHGANECDEVLEFLQERLRIEQSYANALGHLARRQLRPSGLGRNEGATLRKAFEGLVAECARLADVHAKLGREMHSKVIRPLRDFAAEHRARVNSSWKVVDSLLCKASIEFVRAERARQVSERRAKLYESMLATHAVLGAGRPAEEEEGAPPPTPAPAAGGDPGQAQPMVIVGNLALTRREFRAMLGRLRAELPAHEVKFGVFGRFRGLVTGHDLAAWWREHYGSVIRTDEEAAALGQSLVDQGYLRHMGRGSAFVLRPTAYYQWKAAALNFGGGEDDSDGDGEGTSGGGGGSTATAPGKTLAQLRSEAEEADQEHHSQVLKAEIYRADLEEQLGSYLETAEAWEVARLTTLKGLLEQYVAVQAKLVPVLLSSHERQQVCAETIKPAQDIQWLIEQHGTGRFVPRPIVYRRPNTSPAQTQIFGVALDEQQQISPKPIPLFPAKVLSLVGKSAADLPVAERRRLWLARPPPRLVSELKIAVNSGPEVTLKDLRRFDLPVVVNALYLYLSELPECLCTRALYDPVKAFYHGRPDDETPEERGGDLRPLLQAIPAANLAVLKAVFRPLAELAGPGAQGGGEEAGGGGDGGDDREAFVEQLSERLGAIVIRPWLESVAALHDRHPQRLVRDFLEHYSLMLEPVESSNSPPPLPLSPHGSDGGGSDSGGEGTAAEPGAAPMSEAPLSPPATAAGPGDAGRPAQTPKPAELLSPATPGPGRGSPSPPTKDDMDFFLKDDDDDDDDD